VGARPNFVKIAPILNEYKKNNSDYLLVHTGQHYDKNMSDDFFVDLNIPKPNYFLGVGSGTHASQTDKIMIKFEEICLKIMPKLVVVPGDVNSTLACAIVCSKLHIPVAHVESGLRSFDKRMPEEINRILTDRISDILFVTEKSGLINLDKEGISSDKIHFVGNTMIDSLVKYLDRAISLKEWENFSLAKNNYCLLTMHRPSNVDDFKNIEKVFNIIKFFSDKINFILPAHPRLKKTITSLNISKPNNLLIINPLPYINFLSLLYGSRVVVTDSGGIQEESTFLKIPCITLRENTERPVTIDHGTNYLTGLNMKLIIKTFDNILKGKLKSSRKIKFWDGNSSQKIYEILEGYKV
jgi:UDP-N-acetylglucosamine 2-epimerase (non-hydrolysing)